MNDATILSSGAQAVDAQLAAATKFLYHEAWLLDAGRYTDWLNLLDEDAEYWIPARPGQKDSKNTPSIIYENKDLLSMRIRRLSDPRTYQTSPAPRTRRIVGNVLISLEAAQNDSLTVTSVVFIHEYRDEQRRLFSAQCTHVLRETAEGLKIASKRIDLIDCDATHTAFMSLL